MYMTKAILTVKADKLGEITRSVNNEVLREMFSDAENIAGKIITDMNSVK